MIGKEKWSFAENLNIWFREDSSYDSRLETVKIYLKLKQLMIEIDDVDESSDEEGNKVSKSKFSHGMNYWVMKMKILGLVSSILFKKVLSSQALSNL